jgi:hypothetical protein
MPEISPSLYEDITAMSRRGWVLREAYIKS